MFTSFLVEVDISTDFFSNLFLHYYQSSCIQVFVNVSEQEIICLSVPISRGTADSNNMGILLQSTLLVKHSLK